MELFNTLIKSIAFYRVEIFGWKQYECIEALQKKYIKWVLMVERTTPDYIIRRETKTTKMCYEARRRAARYEEKITTLSSNDVRLETYKRKYMYEEFNKYQEEKDRALKDMNITYVKIDEWLRMGEVVSEKIRDVGKTNTKNEDLLMIEESRYAKEIKEMMAEEWSSDIIPEYLEKGLNIQKIAKYRTGGEFRASKHWRDESYRKCRLCKKYEETPKHLFEECEANSVKSDIKKVLSKEGSGIAFILGIEWRLKRIENEENNV